VPFGVEKITQRIGNISMVGKTQLRRDVSGAPYSAHSKQRIGFVITIALLFERTIMHGPSWVVFYGSTKIGGSVEHELAVGQEEELELGN
jgi:hypothetical protein